ncbi:DUF3575 domain-containing protein [Tenacibaculum xiamenense]|uniref:DUF3575 domain-containing protein n=1 Tax=Tenacibaculum xiamenense TaxID=1261553 RepID=UPI0038956D73
MKKLFMIAMIAVGFTAYAQKNVVKANPLALLGGSDLVSYERAIGENSSVSVSGAIGGFKLGGTEYDSKGFGAQYRYYFSEALKAWYAGASASFQFGSVENNWNSIFSTDVTTSKTDFTSINGGVRVGYQWVWESGFSLDLNLGGVYSSFNYEDDNAEDAVFINGLKGSGVLPTFGFGLGYAW